MRRVIRLLSVGLILAGLTLGGLRIFQDRQADDAYAHTQQALRHELRQSAAPPQKAREENPTRAPETPSPCCAFPASAGISRR